jgi:general stress protein 26
MDKDLRDKLEQIHEPDGWVHLATIGPGGEPHVTPVMMGIGENELLFSLTGQQKKHNIQRDNRACISIAKPVTMAHVIVWGTMELRHDAEAQTIWDNLITSAFGDAGLGQRSRAISLEGTSLGVFTPQRHRLYGFDE